MFACRLDECPPGLFLAGDCLGFKSEYRNERGACEAYVVASGEFFWGGAESAKEREALVVTPVEITDAAALRLVSIETE
ncbi:MAG TPA: hypothetical protein DC031_01550 [Sulfitobacter sp.]|uniref:hypothetical protein n=1 Tax=Sulfitobacter dubius TaxID=218673 RepID=UPI000E989A4E|nr:hypothetical protein [Sulfitobacter sp.]